MILRTKKYYLLILLAAFFVGGCGNFSGNYEEIESSASDDTTTSGGTLTLITSWGSLGTSSGQFSNPQYTYVYNSKIYVADNAFNSLSTKKVAIYDLEGNLENEIYFSSMVKNLCIYNNRLYVATGGDITNLNISDTSDNYTINLNNSDNSSISADHCAVNSTNIFVLSDSTQKVYKYSLSNFQSTTTDNATTSWGSGGTGPGQYMGHGSIIADENYIYISSRDGSGITKFDTSGNIIKHIGTPKIRQICFNSDNNSEIFGTDYNTGKFTIFNKELTILKTVGYSGGDSGLSSDSSGNVYISGYQNDYQISKYQLKRN